MDFQNESELHNLVDELTPHLPDYLREHGLDPLSFNCMLPSHPDKNPSAGIVKKNPKFWKCQGCGASGNILHAAHYLEGRPLFGKEFIEDNVNYLARKYGKEPISFEYSEADLLRHKARDVHKALSLNMRRIGTTKVAEQLRKWDESICKAMGVYTVEDFDKLLQMVSADCGINRKQDYYELMVSSKLFGPNKITFTLQDPHGRVIGFASRNLDYEKNRKRKEDGEHVDSRELAKYLYTASGLTFDKDSFVYNLHNSNIMRDGAVYIMEGQGGVLAAMSNGIKNAIATCGADCMTKAQFEAIRKAGISDIILAFDYDDKTDLAGTGQEKTSKVLKNILAGVDDMRIRVVNWNKAKEKFKFKGSMDPEDFINKYGAEAFESIPLVDPFMWQLEMLEGSNLSNADKVEIMLGAILNEPSVVRQNELAKKLAYRLDMERDLILEELKRLRRNHNSDILRIQSDDFIKFSRQFKEEKDASNRVELTRAFNTRIDQTKPAPQVSSLEDQIAALDEITEAAEDPNGRLEIACEGLEGFHGKIGVEGIEIPELYWFIGAGPNVGKSALVNSLVRGFLRADKSKITPRIVLALNDDSKKMYLFRQVASMARVDINKVKSYAELEQTSPEDHKKVLAAWNELKTFTRAGMLEIHDNVFELKQLEDIKNAAINKTSGPVILFVDSFSRLNNHISDERKSIEYNSKVLHQWTKEHAEQGLAIICTVEISKATESNKMKQHGGARSRPTPENLKGSSKMHYDATLVTMLDSPMDRLKESYMAMGDSFWIPEEFGDVPEDNQEFHKPVIHIHFDKNKRGGFKGKMLALQYPEHAHMRSHTIEVHEYNDVIYSPEG